MATKKSSESENEFATSDLYFAAYLQTAGAPLIRADRCADNGGKVRFVFDTSVADIEALKTAWFSNTGKVVANSYAFNIRSLKSLVHTK